MSLASLAILFVVVSVVLLLAEVILPTHGVLGAIGVAGLVAAVVTCFRINQYLGLAAAAGLVCLMPLAATLWVNVWPHTFAGKRLILAPPDPSSHAPAAEAAAVRIGQVGVVISELRPGGVCEFGGARVESRSEHGALANGSRVEIIAMIDGRPLVRAV